MLSETVEFGKTRNFFHQHAKLPFYILVPKLLKEAKLIPVQCKMVSEGKLQRTQRRQTRQLQGQIFQLWDQYVATELTASQLLRKCANIYSPPTVSAFDKELVST